MFDHLLAVHNAPFFGALLLFLGLGALQIASFLIGGELFGFLDDFLPDADADITPADAAAPVGWLQGALGVLGIGKVPAILSVLLFLFWFSFLGYNLQLTLAHTLGALLSPALASVAVLVPALVLLRIGNQVCARILPRDESLAVSEESFIGKLATITLGQVSFHKSAEAKLKDEHNHTHYVQVVADEPDAKFLAGEEVIIIGRRGTRFTVVSGPAHLLEE